jgi:hypothetical protein
MTGEGHTPTTTYRLAPALAVRLVGRSLVTLAAVVAVVTVVGVVADAGWLPAGWATALGLALVAGWAWYLTRRAWAVRLTSQGYAVRLLGGIGVATASWSQVAEVLAASPGGRPCVVLRLHDGRTTTVPMMALAGDADAFAGDVRRRVRDAHS